jgi:hypothetical protein
LACLEETLAVFLAVDDSPGVNPRLEGLIFPDLKCLVINNGWLNNLLALKDTPGYSIDICFSNIFELGAARGVDGLVGDILL